MFSLVKYIDAIDKIVLVAVTDTLILFLIFYLKLYLTVIVFNICTYEQKQKSSNILYLILLQCINTIYTEHYQNSRNIFNLK